MEIRAVVLEALKGHKTLARLSSECGIHAQMITDWKRQVLDAIPTAFETGNNKSALSTEQREQIEVPLFQQIGATQGGKRLAQKKYGRCGYGRINR